MKKWKQHIQFYTAGWFFAAIFFYILRHVGINSREIGLDVPSKHFILLAPFYAIVMGLIFGSLQYFFEEKLKGKLTLPKQLFRMLLVQLIAISFFSLIFFLTMVKENFWGFLFSSSVFVLNVYIFIVNVFFAFIIEIIKLIGRSNFTKLITGKFYTPKEEFRIFLFIDLNSSTAIAEKLGHITYSHFMQDCYSELGVVNKYNTEIYQYVGDEVVFTWQMEKVNSMVQCLDAYWAYRNLLKNKADYFTEKYGVNPDFKAGMSMGMVTVVEIGDFKKEIAYHGNALNTTSRVVDLCNEFGEHLLITRRVFDKVNWDNSNYTYKKITEIQLRGTSGLTEIFSVHEKN